MADRVKQPESAKLAGSGKSMYNLFGDQDQAKKAVEASQKKYEEPKEEVSESGKEESLTDVFVKKYGNNLVGSKLANAIGEFSKDMGIQGAGKEDLAQSYIKVRQPVLTAEQVKSQFSEDVAGKKLDSVDYAPFLKEGYKKLESYGIKVPESSESSTKKTESKSENKETEPAKTGGEDSIGSTGTTGIEQVDINKILNPIIDDIVGFKGVKLTQEQLKKANEEAKKIMDMKNINKERRNKLLKTLLIGIIKPGTFSNPLGMVDFVGGVKKSLK